MGRLWIVLIVCSLLAQVLRAEPSLSVGSEQDFPPLASLRPDGSATGFTVELWEAVARESGLPARIRTAPFHVLLREFKNRRLDVLINLARSPERSAWAEFTVPHTVLSGAIFVRADETQIRSEEDLQGKRVLVLNGDLGHDYALSRGWTCEPAETPADGLRLLSAGNFDAMVVSKLIGLQTLRDEGIKNLVVACPAGYSQSFSFAVRRGDGELLARLNEGLAVVKANGTYDRLYDKWFGVLEPKTMPWRSVLLSLGGLGLVVAILTAAFLHQLALSRQLRLSRARLEETQHLALIGDWEAFPDGRLVLSPQTLRVFAGKQPEGTRSLEEVVNLVDPLDRTRVAALFRQAFEEARSFDTQARVLLHGDYRWVQARAEVRRDRTGKVRSVFGTAMDVTEVRQAALDLESAVSALRQSEEGLRHSLTGLPDPVLLEVAGRIVFANSAALRLFGADSLEELACKPLLEWICPSCRQAFYAWSELAREHQQPAYWEFSFLQLDGSVVPVEAAATTLTFCGSDALEILFRDISARQAAAYEMVHSVSLLHAALESTADGLLVVETNGRVSSYNQTFLRMWRIDPELARLGDDQKLLGAVLEQLKDPQEFLDRVNQLYQEPSASSFETIHFKDGRIFERYSRPQVAQDVVVGRVWSFRDVTERMRGEDALRESELRFRQLAESLDKVFWSWAPGPSRFLYVSPAFEHLWGDSCAELMESPGLWVARIHPEDRERVEQSYKAWLSSGESDGFRVSFRLLRSDGSLRFVVETAASVRDASGQVYRVVGIAEDVTESHTAEQTQRKLQLQLFQSQKLEALGTLAGGIAHDFNNVLAAIVGNAEVLLAASPPGEPLRTGLGEILRASHRARDVVRQILTFSQRREHVRSVVSLSDIVTEVIGLLRATMPPGIEIVAEADPGGCFLQADPAQLLQVAMNLCTNAVQALGTSGRLLVACRPVPDASKLLSEHPGLSGGAYVALVVEDNGPGIEASDQTRLFEPFFTTKPSGEGTGLGLAVVHGIIENHRGAIELESQPGMTRFAVYLPVGEGQEPARPASTVGMSRGDGERLLVLDDQLPVSRAMGLMLQSLGYQVSVCNDPLEALQRLGAEPVDMLITDYSMAGMNGMEVAARCREDRPEFPILLVTGNSEGLDRQAGSPHFEILEKPFGRDDLAAAVRRVLGRA